MTKFLASILALAACTGTIDGAIKDDGDLTPPDCTVRGPRMVRRLTGTQIRNTLRQAFRDPAVPDGDVVTDPVVHGFQVDATQAVVRDLDAQLIMAYAERVAEWAVMTKLGQLASCQTLESTCARSLVETLGTRLFREPLDEATVDSYAELVTGEPTFGDGARVAIATMIQSPRFLYRRELGTARDGLFVLTPYELASSLSYMLTSFPPDDELLAAAETGKLGSPADLDREVTRLIAKAESAATFGQFARDWLQIDDLVTRAKVDPENKLTDPIRAAMLEETSRLFVHVLRTKAPVSELFTAPYTFVDGALAGYYGMSSAGPDQQVSIPAGTRGTGVLGHGSLLARHALADSSSPVQRGKVVRERLLCEELAPPPPNVDANLPPLMGPATTRQRYAAHSQLDACRGCHLELDPVGFTFEQFDGFGRRRDLDNGLPIDTHGELAGMPAGSIPLDGLDSLSAYLATSAEVRTCVTRYLSYNSFGLDHCSTSSIDDELAAGDGSLVSVIKAIVHAPHFTTRTGD